MKKHIAWILCLCFLGLAALSSAETLPEPDGTVLTLEGNTWLNDLAPLTELLEARPDITEVRLYDRRIKLRTAKELVEAFPNVFFGISLKLNEAHTIRTDMTAYSTLGRQPPINAQLAEYFSLLKGLKALDVGHMNLYTLDFLANLPRLKILIVADNALFDNDLDALAGQTELEYLEIFKNHITDISTLSGMTELRDLNLGYNDITDLSPLDGLQKLERLVLTGNFHLKPEEIERFRSLHPACQVVTRCSGSTGNLLDEKGRQLPGTSWRHHPHYDTIHWIFDHSEYISWDVPVPVVKTAADP